VKILLVVGRKKRGKTTMVEKLIPRFKSKGYRVGSIKYTTGDHIFDTPGKDSFRHAQAGAESTLILSPNKVALFSDHRPGRDLDELLRFVFRGCDLVIGEGFKDAPYAKIEVMDASDEVPLCSPEDGLIAVVCDQKIELSVPVFSTGRVGELVDYVEGRLSEAQPNQTVEPE
jgi:molybdopterin-guanine dinucleotide biosynthesis protein MobB